MKRIIYIMQVHSDRVTKHYSALIPEHLAAPEPPAAELKALFSDLFSEHWDTLQEEKGPLDCVICGASATLVKDGPLRGRCEVDAVIRLLLAVRETMQQLNFKNNSIRRSCEVCGSTGQIQKCGRCQLTSYCSTQCQNLDWPLHKKICKARVQGQQAKQSRPKHT